MPGGVQPGGVLRAHMTPLFLLLLYLPLIVVSVANLLLGHEAAGVVAAGGLPEALSYKDRRCGLTRSDLPWHEDVLIVRTNKEPFMRTTHTFRSLNQSNPWLNAAMWLMLAVAGVLLTGFVAVLNGAIERGDLRRANQIMSGSRLLPDEVHREGVTMGAPVLVASERLVSAEAR